MTISPLMPVYPRCDVRPVRGEGCYLFDEQGRKYLDFNSGIAVNALGHGHPQLVKAIQQQAAKLIHVSNLYGSPQGEKLAQKLVNISFADTVFFTNSGSEAIECAIKTMRSYHQSVGNDARHEIITFSNAFHGRSLAAISASNQEKMHQGFYPLLNGFKYIEFDDLKAAKAAVGPQTAGFLVEPIQGEGGIRPASQDFMAGLRELADKHDILLAFDEVQCGVARTGSFYAYEKYGVEPDVLASAKGLGGGFPLGACLAKKDAARGMTFGTHGSTYGGNPLAMAVGSTILEIISEDSFMMHVRDMGHRLTQRLEQFIGNYPHLFDLVRGDGLMLGLKMKVDSRAFVAHLRDNHGLLTVAAGDNVMRLLPPLIIEEKHIIDFMERLSAGSKTYDVSLEG